MQRSCTSAQIYCWEGYPDRHSQNWGGRETWQHRISQVFWNNGMGCSIPRWVSGEVPSLERKTLARAGGKGWTLGMALLSSASLGVFDKLTLCTLSVGLSLSNTRSATLQLPAVTVSSLDANLGTQRGKRSTAAVN